MIGEYIEADAGLLGYVEHAAPSTGAAKLVANISKLTETGWWRAIPLNEGLYATYLWWGRTRKPGVIVMQSSRAHLHSASRPAE